MVRLFRENIARKCTQITLADVEVYAHLHWYGSGCGVGLAVDWFKIFPNT